MTGWIVVGIVFLLVSGGLFWWRSRTLAEIDLMTRVETSSARDAAGKLPGTLVEVKGVARCEAPLQSEYAGAPCVYHQTVQTERYVTHERDAQGRSQRKVNSRTLYANTRHAPFRVEDGSGSVRVEPEGATFEGAEVFNQTEAGGGNLSISVGDVTIGAGGPLDQTWKEHAIATDAAVYVLGVMRPDGAIGAPPPGQKAAAFIISVKSEEQRTADQSRKAWWLLGFAVLTGVAGLACLIFSRAI